MYGGLKGKNITPELWSYNTTTNEWRLITVTEAPSEEGARENEVIAVVAHTAHIYKGTMLVIFGHSPDYGYMNTVQECNLGEYGGNLSFRYIDCTGQFTPKMKANAEPRLLSSLV